MIWSLLISCSGAPEDRPSVLLVVLDTVRSDHTSLGGAPPARTPQLTAIATAGTTWTQVTAPGAWTWPSHASLFTGEAPWVHGAHGASREEGMTLKDTLRVTPLREDLPTLAERFAEAGYRTEALVANRLLSRPLGLTRGFDRVEHAGADEEVVRQAIERMPGEQPLLMFVNLMGAHSPYCPSDLGPVRAEHVGAQAWTEPYRSGPCLSFFTTQPSGVEEYMAGRLEIPAQGLQLLDGLYSGEILEVDRQLNRLLTAWQLEQPGGVLVVTSDHGEYLGEHGLLEHSGSVYSQLTHVPLVLAGPGVPAGVRDDTPVQLQDLFGTMLELAGIERTPHSLARPGSMPADRAITSAAWVRPHLADSVGGRFAQPWRSLRRGDEAVILVGDAVELYDLAGDPGMLVDRAAESPERAQELGAEARELIPTKAADGGLKVDAELIQQLEALGYIQ